MDAFREVVGRPIWQTDSSAGEGASACSPSSDFQIAGVPVVPDPSGALYIPGERILIVADLHLEKGSSLARRRNLLPPYDTAATLARLALTLPRFRPRCVVALGDSFHDDAASSRLQAADRAALLGMQSGRDWIWVSGNHDRVAPRNCGGEAAADLRFGPLALRHLPSDGDAAEIAGHLHPAARVGARGGSVRRRCFVVNSHRCVMPAFGAYAGGLDLHDRAIAGLFEHRGAMTAWVLGRHRVHAISARRCLPER